jgi:hypothetical protein
VPQEHCKESGPEKRKGKASRLKTGIVDLRLEDLQKIGRGLWVLSFLNLQSEIFNLKFSAFLAIDSLHAA